MLDASANYVHDGDRKKIIAEVPKIKQTLIHSDASGTLTTQDK